MRYEPSPYVSKTDMFHVQTVKDVERQQETVMTMLVVHGRMVCCMFELIKDCLRKKIARPKSLQSSEPKGNSII